MANDPIRTRAQIGMRIEEIEDRLAIIQQAIARQRELPFFSRSRNHCHFLDLEKKIYLALCKELKWVLNE